MQGEPDETAEQERPDHDDAVAEADDLEGTDDERDAPLLDDDLPDWDDAPDSGDEDHSGDDEDGSGDDEDGSGDGPDPAGAPGDADGAEPGEVELAEDGDRLGPPDGVPLAVAPWEPARPRHRWLSRILVLVAVLVPAVVVVGVVRQATGLDGGPTIDERLNGKLRYDGTGDPLVRTPNAGVGTVKRREWRVCGAQCDEVSGRGKQFQPGEVLAGSRIEVRVVGTSGETTIVTPNWDGRLALLERPTLTGSPRVGTTVTANPGKWTGGWIGGTSRLGIRACPTKAGGAKCVAFTSSILDDEHEPSRVIPASFRGWWMGAIEWQLPPGRRKSPAAPNPNRPSDATLAPRRSVTVATGPLDGPIR